MREGIVFEELIEKIDLILNSSKPLPYHMKDERKLNPISFISLNACIMFSISYY